MKKKLRTARVAAAAAIAAAYLAAPGLARADAATAQAEISAVAGETGSIQAAIEKAKNTKVTVEERIVAGEFLFHSKDYVRASIVFGEIVEEFPTTTQSYPHALFRRGETYYVTREYLSARRDYRAIVEKGNEPNFSPYFGKALARLVDVSLRVNDIKGLDEVFAKLSMVPPSQVDTALTYAKGKAYYARKDYSNATSALASVPNGTDYTHQARYFQGLVALRTTPPGTPASPDGKTRAVPANYKEAVAAFKVVTDLPGDTEDHRHVIDLAWMAIGRLFYEMESYTQAAEAYSRVGRESPEFATMLYELAWVYVRLGDVQRAERALEILQLTDPDASSVGDGALLRADLMLRAGAFNQALQVYEGVKSTYDPMRAKLEAFIDVTKDPALYYDRLSQQQLEVLDQNDQIPPLAVRWAREAEDGPLAFAVIDDVNHCKKLIRQSYVLVDRLNVIITAANRVRAFPELRAGEERALALLNRVSKARLDIARGLDAAEPGELGGEMGEVRRQRRALMSVIDVLPVTDANFADRDFQGTKQWNTLSQDLSRQVIELDRLQALVNGLRRVMREGPQHGVTRDPASIQKFNAEIDANEKELKKRQAEVVELRQRIDNGRAQIGLGDARYQSDALARMQFRDLLDKEVALAAQGRAGGGAQGYATSVQPVLSQARQVEDRLIASFAQLEAEVARRIQGLRDKIEAERVKINGYNMQLGALDREAQDLVGQVAKKNFELVRDRLRNIVLRADVGITEQAWEVREEALERVRILQTERAREENLLDEELREVLDDSGGEKTK